MKINEIIKEEELGDNNSNSNSNNASNSSVSKKNTSSFQELTPQKGNYIVDDNVKKMQSKLQQLGYNLGPPGVDGKFGPYTVSAVSSFKNDYKLKKTGNFNKKDQQVLDKVLSGEIDKVNPSNTGTSGTSGSSGSNDPLPPGSGSAGGFKWNPGVDQRVKQEVLSRLSSVQKEFDIPFVITSGYRDPSRNKKAGGASKSAHITGEAVDVKFKGSSDDTNRFIEIASRAGFGGIGVYRPGSVHLDIRNKRAWGPSFRAASVPAWARGAISAHVS